MANGYTGNILRVNLSDRSIKVEEPGDDFHRTYLGGRALAGYFHAKEIAPGIDPLGPENKLLFATGPLTGLAVAGGGRNSVAAKSPLTGRFGEAQVGGYFGAELKRAGFDHVIVEGVADRPVYLWVQDGQAELRDASAL